MPNYILFKLALTTFAVTLLASCGGGGTNNTPAAGSTYQLSGQFQKGPFAIGSQISVSELDENLNPTGNVYNLQTSDDLGNFSVTSKVHSHLVEIIGDGFYMDELTGQLSTSRIQLRAIADLKVNPTVTVNILTSLQGLRLKKLITQGNSYAAANTQSQNEVLTAFGVDPTKVAGLSNLYTMKINGSSDPDAVLLALSTVLSKMAKNTATANSTSQPSELSNYIYTIASQIQSTGTITGGAINSARILAATQINIASVRTNVETYYANRGITVTTPKFEEWVDVNGSGVLPRRLGVITDPRLGLVTSTCGATPCIKPFRFSRSTGVFEAIGTPLNILSGVYFTPALNFAYAFNEPTGNGGFSIYSIDANTGSFTSTASTTKSGRIKFNPTGQFAYIDTRNSVNNTDVIEPYIVDQLTGGLTSAGNSILGFWGEFDPQGKFYFVSYFNGISSYSIDPISGVLTTTGFTPIGPSCNEIKFHPSGLLAYLTCYPTNTNELTAYAYNPVTGALTALNWTLLANSITFDPSGKFAYVRNNTNVTTIYTIDTNTGVLTTTGNTVVGVGTFDPSGKFVNVGGAILSVDQTTGTFSAGTGVIGGSVYWAP